MIGFAVNEAFPQSIFSAGSRARPDSSSGCSGSCGMQVVVLELDLRAGLMAHHHQRQRGNSNQSLMRSSRTNIRHCCVVAF